jgi:pilus assembly protein Flp/PilA
MARATEKSMQTDINLLRRFLTDESGATAIEYALIASLIAAVVITGVTAVGTKLSTSFADLGAKL